MNLTKSLKMQKEAKRRIPGMTQLLSKRPDMFSQGVWPGYYSKAKGVEVWDLDGNRYIDMSIAGIGANILGYADPDVDVAVHKAIDAGSSSSLNCPEEVELANLLCEIHPWAEKVRFARTGGESMAIAVRIARAYTGRDKIAFCYDEATEILTQSGFKKFKDLNENEIVATLNPKTSQLEYKQIERKIKYHFVGKMIHFKGQRIDLMVTPDHKIYRKFRLKKGYHFKLEEANKSLKRRWMTQMTSKCKWEGETKERFIIPQIPKQTRPTKGICSFPIKDFVRFMGWYLSEGCCIEQKRGRYEVIITQDEKSAERSEEIFSVIKNLGFTPYRNGHHICFNSKELAHYLKQFGKVKSKYIPEWIKNLSSDYLSIFVDAMIKGDGTFEKGRMRKFYSSSIELIDGMQELLLKMGYSTTVSEYSGVGFSKDKIYHLNIGSKDEVLGCWAREEYFNGNVYCVTVPNHIILVRRNGKIVWSGNCGYHGWHDWYLSANLGTKNALGQHLMPGLDPRGVPKSLTGTAFPFRYNHIEELKAITDKHGKNLAAIVMEPIRNEQPKPGFLKGVRALADKTGAVLIIDEISAGFRMNTGGAHLKLGIKPDIAVFSKALGNGYPIAAVIGRGRVMDAAQSTFISSTMWTERIGPTAALATINKHKKVDAGKHLMEIGSQVQGGWRVLSSKNGLNISIGGIPSLSHFIFKYDNAMAMKSLFVQLMLERGFLASTLFYAMYAHQTYHVEQYLKAVDEAFAEISRANKAGNIEKLLKGLPASSGFKRLT